MKCDRQKSAVDIIEVVGVSLPKELGSELFKQAKTFIARYVETGQPLSHLMNTLHDHQIHFERALETEDNSVLPQELQFSDRKQDVALLQCVIRTLSTSELH